METDVLIYRGWGDNGLGVYGHVLGTDFTYEISQIDPNYVSLSNAFSPAGVGFVFRGTNTSGLDDTLVYSDGSPGGEVVIVNDENGNPVTDPSSFSAFGTQSVFLASTASVSATIPPRVLMVTNGDGAPEVLLPFRVDEYQIVGNSIYAVDYDGGDLYKVNSDYSYELINDRSVSNINSDYLFEFNGELYFRGDLSSTNDFYRVDPGTWDLTALNIAVNGGGDSIYFSESAVGDNQFFYWIGDAATGIELYVSDGTSAGTNLVENINPGNSNSYVAARSTTIGDKLFFVADDGGADDAELWVSDGTAAGTFALSGTGTNVGALISFSASGGDFRLLAVGDKLFFTGNGALGAELYVTDGTVSGTQLVLDIRPGGTSSRPDNFYTDGTYLYFTIESGDDDEAVWISDGTAAGTFALSDPSSASGFNEPSMLSVLGIDVNAIPIRTIDGTQQADTLDGSFLREAINGLSGNDRLSGKEGDDQLYGGNGKDKLKGGDDNDELYGGRGKDKLKGGNGDDQLYGGKGNDKLTGNAGNDRFVFKDKYDKDKVLDFQNNNDTIVLNDNLWNGNKSINKVLNQFGTQQGSDFVFDFGGGDILIIKNATKSQLQNDIDIV